MIIVPQTSAREKEKEENMDLFWDDQYTGCWL